MIIRFCEKCGKRLPPATLPAEPEAGVPAGGAPLCQTCLAATQEMERATTSAALRLQSASAARLALRGPPASGRKSSVISRPAPSRGRLALAVALVVGILAGVGWWAIQSTRRAHGPREVAKATPPPLQRLTPALASPAPPSAIPPAVQPPVVPVDEPVKDPPPTPPKPDPAPQPAPPVPAPVPGPVTPRPEAELLPRGRELSFTGPLGQRYVCRFKDEDVRGFWKILDDAPGCRGLWRLDNGALIETSNDSADSHRMGAAVWCDAWRWKDLRLKVEFSSADDDSVGVRFRVSGPGRFLQVRFNQQNKTHSLERFQDKTWTVLDSRSAGYQKGRRYALEILAQGAQIEVKLDGTAILKGVDDAPVEGILGLLNGGCSRLEFRDLEIAAPQE